MDTKLALILWAEGTSFSNTSLFLAPEILGRSGYYPVQTQQSQEFNPIPTALEQAQEKAETDVDSLVEKETDLYSDLDRPIAKRKGVRSSTQHPLCYHLTYTSLSPTYRAFIKSLGQIQIPNSVQEALRVPEWKASTLEELRALKKNATWTLTNLPPRKRIVGCKWIFSIKHKAKPLMKVLRN